MRERGGKLQLLLQHRRKAEGKRREGRKIGKEMKEEERRGEEKRGKRSYETMNSDRLKHCLSEWRE